MFDGGGAPSAPRRPEVLAQTQRLMLVRGAQPHTVHAARPAAQRLEPHLERRLPVVDQERHLPGPYLHNYLGTQHAPVAEPEAGIEEPGVVGPDLARAGVV